MIIKPCAKINLGLNIVNKRADGYHDLETVFYPVPIYDEIEIREATETKLEIKGQTIEGDPEKNLVMRAYRMVATRYALPPVAPSSLKPFLHTPRVSANGSPLSHST